MVSCKVNLIDNGYRVMSYHGHLITFLKITQCMCYYGEEEGVDWKFTWKKLQLVRWISHHAWHKHHSSGCWQDAFHQGSWARIVWCRRFTSLGVWKSTIISAPMSGECLNTPDERCTCQDRRGGVKLAPPLFFLIGWGLTWSHRAPPRVIWGRRTQI